MLIQQLITDFKDFQKKQIYKLLENKQEEFKME